eukprot:CFRG4953T1
MMNVRSSVSPPASIISFGHPPTGEYEDSAPRSTLSRFFGGWIGPDLDRSLNQYTDHVDNSGARSIQRTGSHLPSASRVQSLECTIPEKHRQEDEKDILKLSLRAPREHPDCNNHMTELDVLPHHEPRTVNWVNERIRCMADTTSKRGLEEDSHSIYWAPDRQCKSCYQCRVPFNTFKRRHHCRVCGRIFCWTCCHVRVDCSVVGIDEVMRVCEFCEKVIHNMINESKEYDNVDERERSGSLGKEGEFSGLFAKSLLPPTRYDTDGSVASASHVFIPPNFTNDTVHAQKHNPKLRYNESVAVGSSLRQQDVSSTNPTLSIDANPESSVVPIHSIIGADAGVSVGTVASSTGASAEKDALSNAPEVMKGTGQLMPPPKTPNLLSANKSLPLATVRNKEPNLSGKSSLVRDSDGSDSPSAALSTASCSKILPVRSFSKAHMVKIIDHALDLNGKFKLGDRRFRLKIYTNCFVASDLIDWLLVMGYIVEREVGIELGQKMLDLELIEPAADHERCFTDDYLLFRFAVKSLDKLPLAMRHSITTLFPHRAHNQFNVGVTKKGEPARARDTLDLLLFKRSALRSDTSAASFTGIQMQRCMSLDPSLLSEAMWQTSASAQEFIKGTDVADKKVMTFSKSLEDNNVELDKRKPAPLPLGDTPRGINDDDALDIQRFKNVKTPATDKTMGIAAVNSEVSGSYAQSESVVDRLVESHTVRHRRTQSRNIETRTQTLDGGGMPLMLGQNPRLGGKSKLSNQISAERAVGGSMALNDREKKEDKYIRYISDAVRERRIRICRQVLCDLGLPESWVGTVESLAQEAVVQIRTPAPDSDDPMDIRHCIKIKVIPGGSASDSQCIHGVVCHKHLVHKNMRCDISHPRVLLLDSSIEYDQTHVMTSMEDIFKKDELLQGLQLKIDLIKLHRPDVVLVSGSVARVAQLLFLKQHISLAINVKRSVLDFVSRCTGAVIVESIANLGVLTTLKATGSAVTETGVPIVGTCGRFFVRTVNQGRPLMYFTECNPRRGVTITLRGANASTLTKVKRALDFLTFVCYCGFLESFYLSDVFAVVPKNERRKEGSPFPEIKPVDRRQSAGEQFCTAANEIVLSSSPMVDFGVPYLYSQKAKEYDMLAYFPSQLYATRRLLSDGGLSLPLDLRVGCSVKHPRRESDTTKSPPSNPLPQVYDAVYVEPSTELQNSICRTIEMSRHPATVATTDPPVMHKQLIATTGMDKEVCRSTTLALNGPDALNPALHQSIEVGFISVLHAPHVYLNECEVRYHILQFDVYTVLYSVELPGNGAQPARTCLPPMKRVIRYYGEGDLSLGTFLKRYCFNSHQCPDSACDRPLSEHKRIFSHEDARISLVNISSNVIVGQEQVLLMWSICHECMKYGPCIPMSEETWCMSFGKFLELSFHERVYGCRVTKITTGSEFPEISLDEDSHSFHRNHNRYFGLNDQAVVVQYDTIDMLLEVVIPATIVRSTPLSMAYDKLSTDLHELQVEIQNTFNSISTELATMYARARQLGSKSFASTMVHLLRRCLVEATLYNNRLQAIITNIHKKQICVSISESEDKITTDPEVCVQEHLSPESTNIASGNVGKSLDVTEKSYGSRRKTSVTNLHSANAPYTLGHAIPSDSEEEPMPTKIDNEIKKMSFADEDRKGEEMSNFATVDMKTSTGRHSSVGAVLQSQPQLSETPIIFTGITGPVRASDSLTNTVSSKPAADSTVDDVICNVAAHAKLDIEEVGSITEPDVEYTVPVSLLNSSYHVRTQTVDVPSNITEDNLSREPSIVTEQSCSHVDGFSDSNSLELNNYDMSDGGKETEENTLVDESTVDFDNEGHPFKEGPPSFIAEEDEGESSENTDEYEEPQSVSDAVGSMPDVLLTPGRNVLGASPYSGTSPCVPGALEMDLQMMKQQVEQTKKTKSDKAVRTQNMASKKSQASTGEHTSNISLGVIVQEASMRSMTDAVEGTSACKESVVGFTDRRAETDGNVMRGGARGETVKTDRVDVNMESDPSSIQQASLTRKASTGLSVMCKSGKALPPPLTISEDEGIISAPSRPIPPPLPMESDDENDPVDMPYTDLPSPSYNPKHKPSIPNVLSPNHNPSASNTFNRSFGVLTSTSKDFSPASPTDLSPTRTKISTHDTSRLTNHQDSENELNTERSSIIGAPLFNTSINRGETERVRMIHTAPLRRSITSQKRHPLISPPDRVSGVEFNGSFPNVDKLSELCILRSSVPAEGNGTSCVHTETKSQDDIPSKDSADSYDATDFTTDSIPDSASHKDVTGVLDFRQDGHGHERSLRTLPDRETSTSLLLFEDILPPTVELNDDEAIFGEPMVDDGTFDAIEDIPTISAPKKNTEREDEASNETSKRECAVLESSSICDNKQPPSSERVSSSGMTSATDHNSCIPVLQNVEADNEMSGVSADSSEKSVAVFNTSCQSSNEVDGDSHERIEIVTDCAKGDDDSEKPQTLTPQPNPPSQFQSQQQSLERLELSSNPEPQIQLARMRASAPIVDHFGEWQNHPISNKSGTSERPPSSSVSSCSNSSEVQTHRMTDDLESSNTQNLQESHMEAVNGKAENMDVENSAENILKNHVGVSPPKRRMSKKISLADLRGEEIFNPDVTENDTDFLTCEEVQIHEDAESLKSSQHVSITLPSTPVDNTHEKQFATQTYAETPPHTGKAQSNTSDCKLVFEPNEMMIGDLSKNQMLAPSKAVADIPSPRSGNTEKSAKSIKTVTPMGKQVGNIDTQRKNRSMSPSKILSTSQKSMQFAYSGDEGMETDSTTSHTEQPTPKIVLAEPESLNDSSPELQRTGREMEDRCVQDIPRSQNPVPLEDLELLTLQVRLLRSLDESLAFWNVELRRVNSAAMAEKEIASKAQKKDAFMEWGTPADCLNLRVDTSSSKGQIFRPSLEVGESPSEKSSGFQHSDKLMLNSSLKWTQSPFREIKSVALLKDLENTSDSSAGELNIYRKREGLLDGSSNMFEQYLTSPTDTGVDYDSFLPISMSNLPSLSNSPTNLRSLPTVSTTPSFITPKKSGSAAIPIWTMSRFAYPNENMSGLASISVGMRVPMSDLSTKGLAALSYDHHSPVNHSWPSLVEKSQQQKSLLQLEHPSLLSPQTARKPSSAKTIVNAEGSLSKPWLSFQTDASLVSTIPQASGIVSRSYEREEDVTAEEALTSDLCAGIHAMKSTQSATELQRHTGLPFAPLNIEGSGSSPNLGFSIVNVDGMKKEADTSSVNLHSPVQPISRSRDDADFNINMLDEREALNVRDDIERLCESATPTPPTPFRRLSIPSLKNAHYRLPETELPYIVLRDDEPSTLIAYFLASTPYRRRLRESHSDTMRTDFSIKDNNSNSSHYINDVGVRAGLTNGEEVVDKTIEDQSIERTSRAEKESRVVKTKFSRKYDNDSNIGDNAVPNEETLLDISDITSKVSSEHTDVHEGRIPSKFESDIRGIQPLNLSSGQNSSTTTPELSHANRLLVFPRDGINTKGHVKRQSLSPINSVQSNLSPCTNEIPSFNLNVGRGQLSPTAIVSRLAADVQNSMGSFVTAMSHDEAQTDETSYVNGRIFEHTGDPHIQLQVSDGVAVFTIRIIWARQFHRLRELCTEGEDIFLRSLSRCAVWEATGGKSGSTFLRTLDGRYILKQMSRVEVASVIDLSEGYLKYMFESIKTKRPTVLAKVLGIYQISILTKRTNKMNKVAFLVMENVFHGRKIDVAFDLKGSQRSRYVERSDKNNVLLDENFAEFIKDTPIYFRGHTKLLLDTAVANDTYFLYQHNVMDYSLLVGINHETKELVVGMIDYIRTYTLDKKMETWVKSSGILGGSGKMPTVVSPNVYMRRFREAIEDYFICLPGKWTSLAIPLKHPDTESEEQEKSEKTMVHGVGQGGAGATTASSLNPNSTNYFQSGREVTSDLRVDKICIL